MSRLVIPAVVFASMLLTNPAEAGPRAFVASTGNDSNTASSCAPTTPCRSFTAALTVVDVGGEIVALDAAGYGAVTITKSVSIIANPGFYAGIAASTGSAVTIATAGVNVTLRGLNINNAGSATTGVNMTNGNRLSIENSLITNFSTGVDVTTAAEVRLNNSTLRDNCDGIIVDKGATLAVADSKIVGGHDCGQAGIFVAGTTGFTTTASVSNTIASGTFVGYYGCASTGSTVHIAISRSTSSNNEWGVATDACGGTHVITMSNNLISGNISAGIANFSGTFESQGNNTVRQNTTNTTGTITAVSGT